MTLDDLRQAALGCASCPLAERRTNVVFGEGSPLSPLVLVGEGPGDEEDKTGRPFVGRAGKLLDQAIQAAGLARGDVYICNTVKCRAADWSTGKPVNRPPTEAEALSCRQWLLPQLKAIQPAVILCVGAPSARNLIKKDFKITVERGRFFRSALSRTIMATLHPSYVLRQQRPGSDGGFSLLAEDIRRCWETAVALEAQGKIHPSLAEGEEGS